MGQGSSRQTNDLVPSSRITKDLASAGGRQLSVVSCQLSEKAESKNPLSTLSSIVANLIGPTGHFREIYIWSDFIGIRGNWAREGLDNKSCQLLVVSCQTKVSGAAWGVDTAPALAAQGPGTRSSNLAEVEFPDPVSQSSPDGEAGQILGVLSRFTFSRSLIELEGCPVEGAAVDAIGVQHCQLGGS